MPARKLGGSKLKPTEGSARLLCQSEKLGLTSVQLFPFIQYRSWTALSDLKRRSIALKSRIGNSRRVGNDQGTVLWLTLTIILTGLMWVPYIIDRAMVRGLMGAMANPSIRNDKSQSAWAQRLYFAHTNAVENLIIFAPLVLILDAQGHSTEGTVIACAVYFWSRLVHAVVYTDGCACSAARNLHLPWGSWRRRPWCWRCSESSKLARRDRRRRASPTPRGNRPNADPAVEP